MSGNSPGSVGCFLCGKPGHKKQDCPNRGPATNPKSKTAPTSCKICGKQGHTKSRCYDNPQRKQDSKGPIKKRGAGPGPAGPSSPVPAKSPKPPKVPTAPKAQAVTRPSKSATPQPDSGVVQLITKIESLAKGAKEALLQRKPDLWAKAWTQLGRLTPEQRVTLYINLRLSRARELPRHLPVSLQLSLAGI